MSNEAKQNALETMIADFSQDVTVTKKVRSERRERICQFEEALKSVDVSIGDKEIDKQVEHHFANGMYVREMYIPKGQVIVSKIHKDETVNVISYGAISVISAEDGFKTYEAPMTFVSKPMTKRIVMAHTDVCWTTVHKNPDNIQDLEKLEDLTIAKDFNENNLLTDINMEEAV